MNDLTNVILALVNFYNLPITRTFIQKELEQHPYPNSLLSISDTLEKLRIESTAMKISTTKIEQIPFPAIAQAIFATGNEFVLITQIENKIISIIRENGRKEKMALGDFCKMFEGIVLIAEASQNSGEIGYLENKRKETHVKWTKLFNFLFFSITLVLSLFYLSPLVNNLNREVSLIVITNLAGTIVSMPLLMKTINKDDQTLNSFCTSLSNSSCDSIVTSQAGNAFNNISWSEIGFLFFLGQFLYVTFFISSIQQLNNLSLLNMGAILFVPYSLFYQYRIARKWCLFCLFIQLLIFINFTLSFSYLNLPNWKSMEDVGRLIMVYMILSTIWLLIKPILLELVLSREKIKNFNKIYRNKDVFDYLLSRTKTCTPPSQNECIHIGKESSMHQLIIISNPYCPPCAQVHKELSSLLNKVSSLQVKLIFKTAGSKDKQTEVVARFVQLREQLEDFKFLTVLEEWYGQTEKDFKKWSKKYPKSIITDYQQTLTAQANWCKKMEIEGTPTIFFNGHQLPSEYRIEDLHYFLT